VTALQPPGTAEVLDVELTVSVALDARVSLVLSGRELVRSAIGEAVRMAADAHLCGLSPLRVHLGGAGDDDDVHVVATVLVVRPATTRSS
jgi:hypothetical protein